MTTQESIRLFKNYLQSNHTQRTIDSYVYLLSRFGMFYAQRALTARSLIRRLGEKVNVRISPHDLRRYSATYASRNGIPLEVVSKVILRHQDLKTTQVYLGKISDSEAIRWMDILHGK